MMLGSGWGVAGISSLDVAVEGAVEEGFFQFVEGGDFAADELAEIVAGGGAYCSV